jgi:RNA polymerase sigma-70 factor, ECF subfamily
MSDIEAVVAPMTEDDLVSLARADTAAFNRLYHAYRLPIYRYLRSRCDSDEDAADLAAITFERAFRGLRRYRSQGSPIGWLLRIARNAAIDASRQHRLAAIRIAELPGGPQVPTGQSSEAAYLAIEKATELQDLVRRLPDPQRDAIALRYASGLTAREIAAVIGKSEAATQKLLSRALFTLKEAYDVET